MKKIAIIAAFALSVPASAAGPAPHGANFLTDAMMGDNGEVQVGRLAQKMGSSRAVRDFGAMLVRDHGAHKAKLAALARGMHLAATDNVTPEARATGNKLMHLRGKMFDRAFAQAMVDGHRQNIAKYEAESRKREDGAVARMASETLPTLRHHLDEARRL